MACATAAVLSARFFDSDGDGFTNHTEVADTLNYSNTPTFPGLSMANTNLVLDLTAAQLVELAGYLTPVVWGDTTLPVVTVITPTGGQTLVANRATNVAWTRHRCQPDHVHQPVPLHHQRGQLADGRRGGRVSLITPGCPPAGPPPKRGCALWQRTSTATAAPIRAAAFSRLYHRCSQTCTAWRASCATLTCQARIPLSMGRTWIPRPTAPRATAALMPIAALLQLAGQHDGRCGA